MKEKLKFIMMETVVLIMMVCMIIMYCMSCRKDEVIVPVKKVIIIEGSGAPSRAVVN